MSSALAAFAKAQAHVPPTETDDDAYASDDHHDTVPERTIPASTKALTLVDVAKAEASPTLTAIAQTLDRQEARVVNTQLTALAADVQAEEQNAVERRSREIAQALAVTSTQVRTEQQATRHSQVTQALSTAVQQPETDDPVVHRAVARVVDVTSPSANRPTVTLSVDRHVLKQRQARHGLDTKSAPKATTLKDKMSAFQHHQLSLTQQRVFLAMLMEDKAKRSTTKRCNMHAIEALAKDRATQRREHDALHKTRPPIYAKLDDTRHCRFQPKLKIHRHPSTSKDDDEDDDHGNQRREDFIRRMEATERVRKEQLRRTRAEREYLAQIDKKECPQCGNPQSYAELTQKRKKCPNCGVTYKSRLAWGEIANDFLARMASHLEAKKRVTSSASSPNNQESERPGKRWQDVQDEFLGRVQLDLHQRQLTKDLILQELEAQCTFTPAITARARRLPLAEFDERVRRDLEARRLRQEQYRLLSAAIAKAEATKTTTRKPLPKGFEQRMQQDLIRRRERQAAHAHPQGRNRGLY